MTFLLFVFYKAFTLYNTAHDIVLGLAFFALDCVFWVGVNIVIVVRSSAKADWERLRLYDEEQRRARG